MKIIHTQPSTFGKDIPLDRNRLADPEDDGEWQPVVSLKPIAIILLAFVLGTACCIGILVLLCKVFL